MKKITLVSDTINRDDINALIEWLQQDPIPRLTKGDLTVLLEERWAKKVGTKHSVFVNSGSSAILLLLAALKDTGKYSNKIICPTLSWVTDVSTPMLLGFNPILCDCNLEDLSCDLNDLEKTFKENQSEKPMLFISVSTLGIVPKINEILELCKKYNVELIEDNCESMGSEYEGKKLGSFGLASVYSMYFGHHISTIEGGFINTSDEDLNERIVSMRSHGWNRDLSENSREKLKNKWNTSDFDELYCFYYPGINLRSTDLQAFIGLRAIEKLDFYSELRNKNYFHYKNLIKNNELNIEKRENSFISNLGYPVLHKKRNDIVNELKKNNVEARPLIAGSIANKPFWIKKYGKMSFVNADKVDKFGLYLPNHQDLSVEDIIFITDIINKFN